MLVRDLGNTNERLINRTIKNILVLSFERINVMLQLAGIKAGITSNLQEKHLMNLHQDYTWQSGKVMHIYMPSD